jgi:flagellar secretion chaperone FliS
VVSYAYRQYQQAQTHTATPGQLVLMLYQGAVKFLVRARSEIEVGSIEGAHNNLIRAQNIIVELMTSLDMSQGQIATDLYALYGYMYRRLLEANIRKDAKIVEEVTTMLRDLLPAWEEAVASVESGRGSAAAAGVDARLVGGKA